MLFLDFAATHKPLLQKRLQQFLTENESAKPALPFYTDSLNKLQTLSTAGKMWRGLFILLIYELVSGKAYPEPVVDAAVALELAQSALLIHDDIIDNDYTRRGQKTIFAQYIKDTNEAYGKSLGICVGDIAFFLAYDALSLSSSDVITLQKLTHLLSQELHYVGIGEMIDVDLAHSQIEPSVNTIIDMYRHKTARYSFSLPFLIGAYLANADARVCDALDTFGENTGILFQIQDDALGLIGDEKATGKPVGADIKENKKTLHRTLLYRAATQEEKKDLDTCFGNKQLTSPQRERVLSLLKHYTIHEEVEKMAEGFRDKARTALQMLPFSSSNKQLLEDILKMVTQRYH